MTVRFDRGRNEEQSAFYRVPLLGCSIALISLIHPEGMGQELLWPTDYLLFFGIWLLFLLLFCVIYIRRTRWLRRVGIYRSWSNFDAYMMESHGYPPSVSPEQYAQFVSWADLPEQRPDRVRDIRKAARKVYTKINAEYHSRHITEETRQSYINSLSWYMFGGLETEEVDPLEQQENGEER